MALEDYQQKDSVTLVYTGEGKGKTSASLGLLVRALGTGWQCCFVQFIKYWEVGEHQFLADIDQVYPEQLTFHKGGEGFYDLGDLSAKDVEDEEHKKAAQQTYQFAYEATTNGDYQLVICDEINYAHDYGLIETKQLEKIMTDKHPETSLCLTGRNFPEALLKHADIATEMTKLKHHFDDKYLANKGIDY